MTVLQKICCFSVPLALILSSVSVAGVRTNDWDYILFTQSWPASVCLQWKAEGKSHSCSFPKESLWTVHGLWPTKTNTKGPSFCNTSLPFDEEALSPILNELEDRWINVDVPTPTYSFWKHEWEKHGTCAAQLPAMDTEVKYFSKGLDFQKQYDMYNALSNAGYSEGKLYLTNDIREAVAKHFGKMPTVHCYREAHSGKVFLFDIRLCFDKSLELIDCPNPMSTNCPSEPVEYPNMSEVSKRYEVRGKWLIDLLRIVRWVQWITY